MAQQGLKPILEKDKLRHELYALLSEGLSENGESNHNLSGYDILSYGEQVCERTGLYY